MGDRAFAMKKAIDEDDYSEIERLSALARGGPRPTIVVKDAEVIEELMKQGLSRADAQARLPKRGARRKGGGRRRRTKRKITKKRKRTKRRKSKRRRTRRTRRTR